MNILCREAVETLLSDLGESVDGLADQIDLAKRTMEEHMCMVDGGGRLMAKRQRM